MEIERVYRTLYSLLPEFYRDRIEQQARYARMHNEVRFTVNTYLVAFVLLGAYLLLFQGSALVKTALTLMLGPIIAGLPLLLFSLFANKRRKQIESVLPDALNLISANVESGLTIDRAFLLAARDEFGPLGDDLKEAAMDMFGGTPVEEALEDLKEDTNSELFAETLNLLQDGIESGGKVSKLLESSANDVQKSLQLREEIGANVKMYSLFITMASMVGAPLLYAVSVFLTRRSSAMWSSQSIDFESLPDAGVFTIQQPSFRPDFFADFAIISILVSNLFAALIISEIKNGSVKDGFKYAPVFSIVGVIIYFVVSALIQGTLGGGF